jgi:hypothetical protein
MLTYYSDDDSSADKQITVDFGKKATYEVYLLDETHNETLIATTDTPTLTLPIHACVLIKEI